jgi:hypothetical protein
MLCRDICLRYYDLRHDICLKIFDIYAKGNVARAASISNQSWLNWDVGDSDRRAYIRRYLRRYSSREPEVLTRFYMYKQLHRYDWCVARGIDPTTWD